MWILGLGWFPAWWCHPLRFPGTWGISLFWLTDMVLVLPLPCLPLDISLHVFEIKGHFPTQFWWLSSTFHLSVGCCAQAEWYLSLSFQIPSLPYPSCYRPFHTSAPHNCRHREQLIRGPYPSPPPLITGSAVCTAIALLAL